MTGISELTIPTSQLETWSRYVEAPQSKKTADIIRNELERTDSRISGYNAKIYLQGSYRNHTNIFRDSDVDIVVEMKDVFYSDVELLTTSERVRRDQAYSPGTKRLQDFRDAVLKQLQDRFGVQMVNDGDKAIAIGGLGERLNADVLVCAEHRKWYQFKSISQGEHHYAPGIKFWTQKNNLEIINFPNVHYENGVAKQESSNQWFKPTVRAIKNARRKLCNDGILPQGAAPSYFVQCLIYNVPDHIFGNSIGQNYYDVVNWLSTANLSGFTCQHKQHALFGNRVEQWREDEARRLITELLRQWRNW